MSLSDDIPVPQCCRRRFARLAAPAQMRSGDRARGLDEQGAELLKKAMKIEPDNEALRTAGRSLGGSSRAA